MTIRSRLIGGAVAVWAVSASAGAMAQCAITSSTSTGALAGAGTVGGNVLANAVSNTASAVAGSIGNLNTVFLTQQGSAFVSAPANPAANSDGGGVWVRGVGGEVTLKSSSSSAQTLVNTPPNQYFPPNPQGPFGQNANVSCETRTKTEFAGVQAGADIAKLNVGNWNIHLGTTAGLLTSKTKEVGGPFSTDVDAPFVGAYVVATHGRFFADMMYRQEFYNLTLSNPTLGYNGQTVGAHGHSITASMGYNFLLKDNWFIEPSAGFVYSRTSVDQFIQSGFNDPSRSTSFAAIGGTGNIPISGTHAISDIETKIGRLSLRVGTTFEYGGIVWQPFVSASVFHEFAGDVSTSYATPNGQNTLFFTNGDTADRNQLGQGRFSSVTNTTRVGTYGQYSAGFAAQLPNTGWLGFVRGDYRNGEHIEGWTANAGLRYQFSPHMMAMASGLPMKAPVKALPSAVPVNWTGFYIGAHAGADYGRSEISMGAANSAFDLASSKPHIFGPIAGGQIGYNHQIGQWVFGAEGDARWADIKGSRSCGSDLRYSPARGDSQTSGLFGGLPVGFSPFYENCNNKIDWVATATAKVGYSWGRTLYYVKGGAAWAEESTSVSCLVAPALNVINTNDTPFRICTNPSFTAAEIAQAGPIFNRPQIAVLSGNVINGLTVGKTIRSGWTIGYGTEFAFNENWSAKGEYNYIDLGSRSAIASDGVTRITTNTTISEVKIGVNYKFAPVMQR